MPTKNKNVPQSQYIRDRNLCTHGRGGCRLDGRDCGLRIPNAQTLTRKQFITQHPRVQIFKEGFGDALVLGNLVAVFAGLDRIEFSARRCSADRLADSKKVAGQFAVHLPELGLGNVCIGPDAVAALACDRDMNVAAPQR
jgi:hypothetical protein